IPPATSAMFECSVCSRSYATQSSLTRHAHNHASEGRHTCSICDISFRRKDLLARHERIHQVGASSRNERDRRRCHTACQPCGVCSQTQAKCSYGRPTRRKSRRAVTDDLDEPDQDSIGSPATSAGLEEPVAATITGSPSPLLFDTNAAPAEQFPLTPGSLLVGASDQNQLNPDEQEFANILALMHTAPHENFSSLLEPWSTAINWPWTHEDLYLRNGPDYGPSPSNGLHDLPLSTGVPGQQAQDDRQQSTAHVGNDHTPESNAQTELPMTPTQIVDIIINEALDSARDQARWIRFWESASDRVRAVFNLSNAPEVSQSNGILDHFVDIYLEQFQPLWPLIWQPSFERGQLHPLLLLTMTSIGALYSGSASSRYGSLLHEKMREILLVSPPRVDHTDQENLDLGRAMLLTQVAAIYFEQQHAFSAAQKLGALLNVHAQKMRLFSYRPHRGIPTAINLQSTTNTSAIGWHKQIALDPNEVLPLLQPLEHELLLYGLQYSVWRFSHDSGMFKRLTGLDADSEPGPTTNDLFSVSNDELYTANHDHLDYSTRKMAGLRRERQNVICALRKWKSMVASSQMSNQYGHNRTTYLSGLMLFHLSFLRLHAPVGTIQQVVYHQGTRSESVEALGRTIVEWSTTDQAVVAIKHACSMWTLIEKETSRPTSSQARYTILTVISVYQAATVIWAVAGACEKSRQSLNMMGSSKHIESHQVELSTANTPNLMSLFAELFPKMTSTWKTQSSFLDMVLGLATKTLM
ncbi:unnamed protein product, partial [Aureobasidium uvarum]